jgi:hypothetical protein
MHQSHAYNLYLDFIKQRSAGGITSQNPKLAHNTYEPDNGEEKCGEMGAPLSNHMPKIQKQKPHQQKSTEGIADSPYGGIGAHNQCSRSSASAACSRFRNRHLHQHLVHLQSKALYSS